jgi:hypothetical protein
VDADKVSNFCKTYSKVTQQHNVTLESAEKISSRALDSFDQCVKLASKGIKIEYNFVGNDLLRVTFTAGDVGQLEIGRLHIKNMKCSGTLNGNEVNWNRERSEN